MSQPFKLYRLQQVDSLLDQARARLQSIDNILKNDSALKAAQARLEASEIKLRDTRRELHRAEEETRAQGIKKEQTEAALYGGKVHNPKELQDLQKESASLSRLIETLEERQLEQMIAVEEAENLWNAAKVELSKVEAQLTAKNQELTTEKARLIGDVSRMEAERQTTASTIPPGDIQLYEQLRQQRRGVAVAIVSENTCAACGSTLTPSQVQQAHSPGQLARCTFCGRILYAG